MRGGGGGGGGANKKFSSSTSSSTSGANNQNLVCSRVYNRRRTKQNVVVEDIISHLPQDILHHIFSFLDMKQAIQTCILSRRWRYFWVSLPILKFIYIEGLRNTTTSWNEFMDFVDKVLIMFPGGNNNNSNNNNNNNIHEFVIVTDGHRIDRTDRLNAWILASVIRNVQQLTLDIQFPEKFHLHQCLFTCKSLTKLVVRAKYNRVSLGLLDEMCLPRLKTLSFRSVQFEDEEDSTNQLFSNCPVLESLTITFCEFPHINVNISSPLLQHLELTDCGTRSNALDLGPVDTKFHLWAPNLISFYWYNDMSIHCDPKNLSSLVKADISTVVYEDSKHSEEKKAMYAPFMVNLLRGIHNVEDLTLSASFLEVIAGAPYLLDSQPTKFCNLRCLKLESKWRSVDCIHAIPYLLKISPNIETLSIKVVHGAPDLLEVQPTQICNLKCLKMETLLSKDCIYAIAYFLKISPKIEFLSFTVSFSCDEMHPYWDEITLDSSIRGDYWEAGLSLECLLNQIKCFELRDVTGRINELVFIEILLKNAMVLEELVIICDKTYYIGRETESVQRRLVKFKEKVLTFPRASSSVVIMFKCSCHESMAFKALFNTTFRINK